MVKSVEVFFSVILAVLIMSAAAKLSLNYKGLYYSDINRLKISETVNMKDETIKENYNLIIGYLQSKTTELNLPDFNMSLQGKTHFKDVRNLYKTIDKIFYISLIITVIGIIVFTLKKLYDYMLYSAVILIGVPIILSIFSLSDFNYLFTLFHKLAFNNDLWLFDPAVDPVINILPEKFFMHEAMFIFSILLVTALMLLLIYRKTKNKKMPY
jgi:integral membrane protein (TIGR01906 family)